MALDVKVKIELTKPAGGMGFGIPLLLEAGAEKAVAYTECYTLEDVVTAGYAVDTDMYKAASMLFAQTNRPEKIAVCSATEGAVEAATKIVSKDWRQLVIVGEAADEFVAVADYIETTKNKMFFVSMNKETFEATKETLTAKKYDRTVILVCETENAAAALVGETAGRAAGSFTYKFKTLKGVAADDLTDAQITELHEAGAIGYVTKAGDNVTTEGFSQSKKYIDITDSIDYVIGNIEYRIQKVFNGTAKVPYDDRGIAMLSGAVTLALQDAYNNGIIAVKANGKTPDYSVSFKPRAATTEADRESRTYKYGSFRFALAGAVHYCEVFGEITY